MAHFAKLNDSNIVQQVIVIGNDVVPDPAPANEQAGVDFIVDVLKLGGTWKQCSINANFRAAYPGIGWTYNAELDEFVAPVIVEPEITEPPVEDASE
jgi:hypothetical protein